jgi:DivIVA domain-containing protein
MTDDGFHLTALDVRRYDFGNALRGYDRTRVDQFRDQVAEEIERLTRANQELDQKARNFHEQLKAFRERDKALNDALVSAQQLRGDIREQAEREALLIVREARAQADAEVQQVRDEVRRAEEELQKLWRTRRGYLTQLRNQVERQLSELMAAESEPPPPYVQTREQRADASVDGLRAPSTVSPSAQSETPPMLQELRDLPVRPPARTPSWLDAMDDT